MSATEEELCRVAFGQLCAHLSGQVESREELTEILKLLGRLVKMGADFPHLLNQFEPKYRHKFATASLFGFLCFDLFQTGDLHTAAIDNYIQAKNFGTVYTKTNESGQK